MNWMHTYACFFSILFLWAFCVTAEKPQELAQLEGKQEQSNTGQRGKVCIRETTIFLNSDFPLTKGSLKCIRSSGESLYCFVFLLVNSSRTWEHWQNTCFPLQQSSQDVCEGWAPENHLQMSTPQRLKSFSLNATVVPQDMHLLMRSLVISRLLSISDTMQCSRKSRFTILFGEQGQEDKSVLFKYLQFAVGWILTCSHMGLEEWQGFMFPFFQDILKQTNFLPTSLPSSLLYSIALQKKQASFNFSRNLQHDDLQ